METEDLARPSVKKSSLDDWIRWNILKEEPEVERPLRVAFYIRGYSNAGDGIVRIQEHSAIWQRQYETCMAASETLGCGPPVSEPLSDIEDGEYIDHTPARLDQQEALRSLLKRLLTKRDIDVVIVTDLSRLSRDAFDCARIQSVIEHAGAKLVLAGAQEQV